MIHFVRGGGGSGELKEKMAPDKLNLQRRRRSHRSNLNIIISVLGIAAYVSFGIDFVYFFNLCASNRSVRKCFFRLVEPSKIQNSAFLYKNQTLCVSN